MAISDPLVTPLMLELLECYEQELAKVADPPLHIGVRPGSIVDFLLSTSSDECCEGLGWVRPAAFEPLGFQTDQRLAAASNIGIIGWQVTLELGIVRCAPTPDENAIPSQADWLAVAIAVNDASAAMRRAICCFIDAVPGRAKKVQAGAWQPVAVQGGCVGGLMLVTIQGPACDCIDAGSSSS